MSSFTPETPRSQPTTRQEMHDAILRLADDEISAALAASLALQLLDFRQMGEVYDALYEWRERRDRGRQAARERFGYPK
jgi:hypothetical protein